ncbi:MAG: fibronectin type III domain-containing protein, partial [Acidimicrobiia bacterium]
MLSKSMSRLFHVGSGGGRTLVVAFAALTFLLGALPAAAAILTLNWADASTNEDGFKVERKTGSTGTYGQVANLAAGTTGYVDGAVTAGTTYCFRVRAYNSAGNSAYSNEACATPASTLLYTIAVTTAGTGSGTVASSPSAINCGTTCSASVASGTIIALSATAATGSTFTRWSGACTGTGGCALVVDAAK